MNLKSCLFVSLLGVCSASPAVLAKPPVTQVQEAQTTAEMYTLAETIKAVENQLVTKLIDERANKTLHKATQKSVRKLMDKALAASRHLSQSEKVAVLKRLANSSKQSLKQLSKFSSSRWQSYIGALGNTKAATQLKKLVASSADEASHFVLQQMAQVDQLIKQGQPIAKSQLKALMDGIKKLPPEQAKAGYDLVVKKLGSEWKAITKGGSATASFVGTVVDGVFVLNDAYSIYYNHGSAEEKFIQASGKIIEYSASTGSMVAVGAAQGAGATALSSFLPGLVVALSANRVATLYSEIMLLQRDRANARDAQAQARLDLALLVRRQLLKVNTLIQQGDLSQASFFLIQTERYLHKHSVHAQAQLFKLLNQLEAKLKSAERVQKMNAIINQARYPYKKALLFYRQGRELAYATQQAKQALDILRQGAKDFPELKKTKAYQHTQQLIAAIKQKQTEAETLAIVTVSGQKQVVAGSTAYFTVKLKGGVPDYQLLNLDGYGDSDSVMIAWDAPTKTGKQRIPIRIQDDQGKQVRTQITVNVVEGDMPAVADRFQQYADPFYAINFSQLKPVKLKDWKGFYPAPYTDYWGDKSYEDSCVQGVCWKPFHVVQYRHKTTNKPAGMVLGFEDKAHQRLRVVAYYVGKEVADFRDAVKPKSYPYDPPSMWYGEQGIKGFMTFDSQGRKTYQRYTYVRGANFFREEKSYENGKLMYERVRRNDTDTLKEKDYTPEPTTEAECLEQDLFEGWLR